MPIISSHLLITAALKVHIIQKSWSGREGSRRIINIYIAPMPPRSIRFWLEMGGNLEARQEKQVEEEVKEEFTSQLETVDVYQKTCLTLQQQF